LARALPIKRLPQLPTKEEEDEEYVSLIQINIWNSK